VSSNADTGNDNRDSLLGGEDGRVNFGGDGVEAVIAAVT
jgi:hypothetical protein